MKREIVGDEQRCTPWLQWGIHQHGIKSYGRKAIDYDGYIYIVEVTEPRVRVIEVSNGFAFLCHPRSGTVHEYPVADGSEQVVNSIPAIYGGYIKSGKVYLTGGESVPYPLIDNDAKTFVVDPVEKLAKWAENNSENYGNIWWMSSEGDVLHWRGNTNGLLPIPGTYKIAGLTHAVTMVEQTAFDKYIYLGGALLCECPIIGTNPLVLGAFYATDTNKVKWLICVSQQHIEGTGDWIYIHRSKDLGKTFELLSTVKAGSDSTISAQIAPNGLKFSIGRALFVISEKVDSISVISQAASTSSGSKTLSGATYTYEGTKTGLWSSIDSNSNWTSTNLSLSTSLTSSGSGGTTVDTRNVPVYWTNPAQMIGLYYIDGGFIGVTTDGGKYCDLEWSGDYVTYGDFIMFDSTKCSATVTATLKPQGISASISHVRVPSNVISTNTSTCGCAGAGVVYTAISGSGRQRISYVVLTAPTNIISTLFNWGRSTDATTGCTFCGKSGDIEGYNPWYPTGTAYLGKYYGGPTGLFLVASLDQTISGAPLARQGSYQNYNGYPCDAPATGSLDYTNPGLPTDTATTKYVRSWGPSYTWCDNGGRQLNTASFMAQVTLTKYSSCIEYLGELGSGPFYDVSNNPVTLPTLAGTAKRYICQVETLGC